MAGTVHILGVAHTISNQDYLACAFTAKTVLFPDVIRPYGWYVIEYSNEGSQSDAHEHVAVLTKDRFMQLSKRRNKEDAYNIDLDNKELCQAYQESLIQKLISKAHAGDIVCHVWGPNIEAYNSTRECHHVELSVGYSANPGLPFRIFESSAWMHYHYAKAGEGDGHNYKWVIPSAFDEEKWRPCYIPEDYAIYLGRVTPRKGINTLVEVARRMPNLPIHVYGPGDTSLWENDRPVNLLFKGMLHGDDRVEALRRARCMLMPTSYIEPFGFSGIEAQLCGVPLLGTGFGAFHETIIDGVTGFRCHTLADWTAAIQESSRLDREHIARSARERYSRRVVGAQYDWVFKQITDLSSDGWYGLISRKFEASKQGVNVLPSGNKVWLFIPYFGKLPDFFSLYLESLGLNKNCIEVVLITDVDLEEYDLPENLHVVVMTIESLRKRVARFLSIEFHKLVSPDEVILDFYKLCDYKILYPELFRAIGLKLGVTDRDFVGWGDLDLIFGRLGNFLMLADDYDIVGGFHGHLTAFRNTDEFRSLFQKVPGLLELLLTPENMIVDERAFRGPLVKYIEERSIKMLYINRYFVDVVPSCFVHLYRPGISNPELSFIDLYHPEVDIHEIRVDRSGRITVVTASHDEREVAYAHFQKRRMRIEVRPGQYPFYARRDGFYLHSEPTMTNIA